MKTKTRLVIVMLMTIASLLTSNAMGAVCTYESVDVPKNIPDNGPPILSDLTVPDPIVIRDIDVVLTIMHDHDTDMEVYLIAPNGTVVKLFKDIGGYGDNFIETRLDDEAAISLTTCCQVNLSPWTGSYQPQEALSAFDGMSANGTWQLKVRDNHKYSTGFLKSWRIAIDFAEPLVPANPKPVDGTLNVLVNPCLSWSKEPTAGITWDVYMMDASGVMQLAAADLTEPNFCPANLNLSAWTSWQVVAKLACAKTIGPVWSFYVPNIIYVTNVPDVDKDGIMDDQGWIDWLTAQGYNVDARRANWQELDPNKIAELEAADLIIVGRGTATGNYNQAGEPTQWNSFTTPMINLNMWQIRGNVGKRWGWLNNPTDAKKDGGSPSMMVMDPTHPIFAGVTIDADGLANVLDPTIGSGGTSFLDTLDVGNGTLLAQSLGVYNAAWIVEWPVGVEYFAGAGQFAGGKRLLFSAGSQDGVPGQTTLTPQGAFNLNDEGQKLMRNAIRYMMGIEAAEIPIANFSFELPGTAKIKGWNGEGVGGTPAVDIPDWSSDAAATDSGVESDWPGHTDGVWTGFLRGTDPSAWNLTDYVIKASDVFILFVDARDNWTESASMPAKLQMTLYCLVGGVRTPLAITTVELTTTWNTYSLVFTANTVPAAVGSKIGIELTNATPSANSWIGMDNVHLINLAGSLNTKPVFSILKLDINTTNTDPNVVEPGFTSFILADSGKVVNGVKIEIAGINAPDSRRRGAPTGIPFEQLYRDFIFGRLPTAGPGMVTVTLSGLLPNMGYGITLYSFDINSNAGGPRIADWTANGEFVFETVMDATVPPTAADSYAFMASVKSDATGRIVLVGLPAVNTAANQPFAFINGLELSSTVLTPAGM